MKKSEFNHVVNETFKEFFPKISKTSRAEFMVALEEELGSQGLDFEDDDDPLYETAESDY